MKGRMYFDLFGHRDYNMMQPFFIVDPVLKQPLRGSRRPRSYITGGKPRNYHEIVLT